MRRIGNDPDRYVQRASLRSASTAGIDKHHRNPDEKRAREMRRKLEEGGDYVDL